MEKKYRVKVVEKHCDYVEVIAESEEDAERKAMQQSNCEFECVYEAFVVSEEDIKEDQ